jgi:AraC-like DNA-binding protein
VIVTQWTTEDLPRSERFTWWHDMIRAVSICDVRSSECVDDFRATAKVMDLGVGRICSLAYPSVTAERTPKLIRQDDPEYVNVALTLSGSMWITQDGHETALGDGDLMIYHSSRPHRGWAAADPGTCLRHIVAQVPRHLLPVRASHIDELTATRLPADGGFGELLAQFLGQVTAKAHHYGTGDTARLSSVLLDLLAATVAQHTDDTGALGPETRQHAMALRVQGFILRHLGNPDLTPGMIAAAHHISTRSLHRLFRQQGTTVAAFIRRHRLDRARRDLADPMLAGRPVHAIAGRWGFTRAADFTRAFRTAFGVAPTDYRETVLGGGKTVARR